ncbi:MAG TPA: M20/M25/M40 family metallo-hydrolase [Candidatus Lokiarchaeia archaeon]|nr:M20/M25/M40 family metallo-hydrolase [Candidatus Lokiarchaeia archaeon]
MEDSEIYALLKQYAEVPGPVGHEEAIQQAIEKDWKKQGLKTSRDRIGNLFGHLEGNGQHLAIVGHADSLGFIVQQVLSEGFLKVASNTAAAPVDARFLPGVPLRFLTKEKETVDGIFGLKSGHLISAEARKDAVSFEEMFVDLGVDSHDAVKELGIDVGIPAVFASPVVRQQQNVVGPSMDNRIAGTIQTLLARMLNFNEDTPNLTLISTVQEEIGMKGAAAAAKKADFDAVIVVDVGLTGDIPTAKNDYLPTKLGAGPTLLYKDFSIVYSPAITEKIEHVAIKHKIPYQKGVFKNYSTDGVHFFQNSIPTAMIAVPCRYTHTPFETVRLNDMQQTIALLYKFVAG